MRDVLFEAEMLIGESVGQFVYQRDLLDCRGAGIQHVEPLAAEVVEGRGLLGE